MNTTLSFFFSFQHVEFFLLNVTFANAFTHTHTKTLESLMLISLKYQKLFRWRAVTFCVDTKAQAVCLTFPPQLPPAN